MEEGKSYSHEKPIIKCVVVPTDFSEESLKAIPYALNFAQSGTEIYLLHVTASPQIMIAEYPSFFPAQTFSEEVHKRAEKELNAIVSNLTPKNLNIKPVIRTGTPFVEIIAFAKEKNADLIIIATHGTTAASMVKHILMGSTAERVVRKSPCSVLAVKTSAEDYEVS